MTGGGTARDPPASWLHGLCLGLLATTLAYAVYREGGRNVLHWNVCLILVGLAALAHAMRADLADAAPPMARWLAGAALLAPAAVALQLVPLPLSLVHILSPARAEIAASLDIVGPAPAFAPLSIHPGATVPLFVNIVSFALVFFIVRDLAAARSPRHLWALVAPLVAMAAVEAALGVWQAAEGLDVEGTYRSRNHLAGLLEMALPLPMAGAAMLVGGRHARGRSRAFAWVPDLSLTRCLAVCAGQGVACLILVGLTESLSKMGFVAGLAGVCVMGAVALGARLRGAWKWAGAGGVAAACLLVYVFLPTDALVARFASLAATGDLGDRAPAWRDTVSLVRAYPLVGSGLGTFGTAFQRYQTADVDSAWTFAHNDYLQLSAELGLVGFAAFLGLMLGVAASALGAATMGQSRHVRMVGVACAGALAAMALHSLVDFNTYIPANAFVLAWISGVAASLAAFRGGPARRPAPLWLRRCALAVPAVVLVLYGSAGVLFATRFQGDVAAERRFCRLGICDSEGVLRVQAARYGTVAAVPVADLVALVRRDPASPSRWADLGEAMRTAGRIEEARRAFATAVALGPFIPPVLLEAAGFSHDLHEDEQALRLTARVLEKTAAYDESVFDRYVEWYLDKPFPPARVLELGLPTAPRARQAYLRYLVGLDRPHEAAAVWAALVAQGQADAALARAYVRFLYGRREYEAAARTWAASLGEGADGYLESSFVWNGGFELEPAGVAFDWGIGRLSDRAGLNDEVEAAVDASVARSGTRSLRLRFGGHENAAYTHTAQTTLVAPGTYRFQAFVRSLEITSAQGIGFRIFDPEAPQRVDVRTMQVVGTNDWTAVRAVVRVPEDTRRLVVQVVRPPSSAHDTPIRGTVWIDDVSLVGRVQEDSPGPKGPGLRGVAHAQK